MNVIRNFRIVKVDYKYCDYLRQFDNNSTFLFIHFSFFFTKTSKNFFCYLIKNLYDLNDYLQFAKIAIKFDIRKILAIHFLLFL